MSQFFAAGGVPIQYSTNTSGSFTTPVSGKYLITAIGGGGGGGGTGARGGGGGGLAQSLVSLSSGVVLTLTVGAGGAGGYPGTAGGTTTVSGSGITTLTANGGAISTGTGGAGGSASGGNIMNVTGGSAGNGDYFGGGAVGVYGTTPAASSAQYAGASVTGAPLVGLYHNSGGFLNGRLLQPPGGLYWWTAEGFGYQTLLYPGQGAMNQTYNFTNSANAGLFAGGGGIGNAGKFGGGGHVNTQGTAVAGGVGGVIIEYFLA
jgi:hypothetical protein